jgi:protein phosphatase
LSRTCSTGFASNITDDSLRNRFSIIAITMSNQHVFECCGMTNIGHRRKANEDHFLISKVAKSMRVLQTSLPLDHQTRLFGETQAMLLLVADGMGGHAAGERASQLVIDGVVEYVLNHMTWLVNDHVVDSSTFEEELKRALIGCQARIAKDVEDSPQRRGMGSTLTLAYIVWPRAFVLHVGDSRCYLFRSGQLRQLTRDHNLANLNQLGDQPLEPLDLNSVIDEEEDTIDESPMGHVLWNVVAAEAVGIHPDAFCVQLEDGDELILCTDGLYHDMSRKRMKSILLENGDSVAETCNALVQEALNGGGSDNITVIVARCGVKSEGVPQAVEIELPENGHSCQ